MKAATKRASSRSIRQLPAKSAIPEALKSNVVRMTGGGVAEGKAVADAVWKASQGDGKTWRQFFMDVLAMGTDGRKAFRSELNAKKKGYAESVKAIDAKMTRTAGVRISECFTVSKAADAGMTVANLVEAYNAKAPVAITQDQLPHPFIVTYARQYLNAGVAVSPRRHVVLGAVEKVKRYILTTYKPTDLPAIAKMLDAIAKRVKTPEQAAAELTAKPAAAPVAVKGRNAGKPQERRTAARAPVPAVA